MGYIVDSSDGGRTDSGIRHDCSFKIDNIQDADRLLWLWVEEASNAVHDCFDDELERVVELVGYDGLRLLNDRLDKFSEFETVTLAMCFEDRLFHALEDEDGDEEAA
jgi:hypothetical protein